MGFRDRSSGRVVAHGLISLTRSWPDAGLLAAGVVAPAHRGRGLGGALLSEGVRRAAALEPGLRVVDTWNVDANHKIRAIITRLGFREVADWTNWRLR